ncbi:polyubiquitin 11-like [Impatiens glandulifera]|uniref:polyubiquitin 11-like n=1 Tax=Impatiens glandulifera TaxID=253017 RepID=UPI001FB088D0|nr:polyubiquitin 11-like [Impatiens glandulifera]
MEVLVKTVSGKTIKLVVESSDPIDCATVKIDEDTAITLDVQKELTDPFEIIIKTLDAQSFTLVVGSSDTIRSVRAKIKEKIKGYPDVDEQRLIFEGKQLCDDSHILKDYHIHNKSIIRLIPRLGGGSSKRKR